MKRALIVAIVTAVVLTLLTLLYWDDFGDTSSDDGVKIHPNREQYDSQQYANDENFDAQGNTEEEGDTTEDNADASAWIVALTIVGAIVGVPAIIFIIFIFVPLGLWWEARMSGVKIAWATLFFMRWRQVPHRPIVKAQIRAKNAGIDLSAEALSDHYLARVDIDKVVDLLIEAHNSGLDIELDDLAKHFLAKVDIEQIVHAMTMGYNAGITFNINELASDYLAEANVVKIVTAAISAKGSNYSIHHDVLKEHDLSNGNVIKTVDAYIAAKKANLEEDFNFSDIAAIDLAGLDVLQAIESAIKPRLVETGGVTGFARDGVQLTMKVKVTLRSSVKNIIGGVKEDTVLARVNEGLVTEIGQSKSHYDVLASPFELADRVEERAEIMTQNAAYFILSIDVSDIIVGKDIHAELKIERAHAEAEMAKAEVIKAEEKVQKAMAAAFIDGNLSIHDYHAMQNTEADTHMRKSFARNPVSDPKDNNPHKGGHH